MTRLAASIFSALPTAITDSAEPSETMASVRTPIDLPRSSRLKPSAAPASTATSSRNAMSSMSAKSIMRRVNDPRPIWFRGATM